MILENNNLRKKLTDGSFEGLCQNSDDFKKLEQAKTINEARKILAKYGYVENLETFRKEIIDLILENEETLQTVSGGRGKKPVAASSVLAMLAGLNLHLPVKATLGEKLLDLEIAHSMKENNDKLNNANNSPAKILAILGTVGLTPVIIGGGLKYAINIAGENRLIKDICENRLVKDGENWVRLEEKVQASTDVKSLGSGEPSLICARNKTVPYQEQILGVLNGLLEHKDALKNTENLTWICNLLVADWNCIIDWLRKDEVLTKDQQISIAATLVTLIRVLVGTDAYAPTAGIEDITREILRCSTTTECRTKLTVVASEWMQILTSEGTRPEAITKLLKDIKRTLGLNFEIHYNSDNQDQNTNEEHEKENIIGFDSVQPPADDDDDDEKLENQYQQEKKLNVEVYSGNGVALEVSSDKSITTNQAILRKAVSLNKETLEAAGKENCGTLKLYHYRTNEAGQADPEELTMTEQQIREWVTRENAEMEKEAAYIENNTQNEERKEANTVGSGFGSSQNNFNFDSEDAEEGENQNNYPQKEMTFVEAVQYLKSIGYLSETMPLNGGNGKILWTIGPDYMDKYNNVTEFTLQQHIANYNAALESAEIVYVGDEKLVFIELVDNALVNNANDDNDDENLEYMLE